MSVGIEEIEKFVIYDDDIDFEIIKYVDNFMQYDISMQKDILHYIIKYWGTEINHYAHEWKHVAFRL